MRVLPNTIKNLVQKIGCIGSGDLTLKIQLSLDLISLN